MTGCTHTLRVVQKRICRIKGFSSFPSTLTQTTWSFRRHFTSNHLSNTSESEGPTLLYPFRGRHRNMFVRSTPWSRLPPITVRFLVESQSHTSGDSNSSVQRSDSVIRHTKENLRTRLPKPCPNSGLFLDRFGKPFTPIRIRTWTLVLVV